MHFKNNPKNFEENEEDFRLQLTLRSESLWLMEMRIFFGNLVHKSRGNECQGREALFDLFDTLESVVIAKAFPPIGR